MTVQGGRPKLLPPTDLLSLYTLSVRECHRHYRERRATLIKVHSDALMALAGEMRATLAELRANYDRQRHEQTGAEPT